RNNQNSRVMVTIMVTTGTITIMAMETMEMETMEMETETGMVIMAMTMEMAMPSSRMNPLLNPHHRPSLAHRLQAAKQDLKTQKKIKIKNINFSQYGKN